MLGRPKKKRPDPLPEQLPPPGARAISLTRGWVTWVDEADYAALARFAWSAKVNSDGHVTAVRVIRHEGRQRSLRMHREILQVTAPEIDHWRRYDDFKVIDNRRDNLRPADRSMNAGNARPPKDKTTSRFKGVSWSAPTGNWRARLGDRVLGYFAEQAEAARAYDLEAVLKYGDFAFTNFQVPGSTRWLFS